MERFLQDLKFGARLLWKDKGFTLTALLTLVVCIGANAAIFTVVRSVLLRPLPFPESERVVLTYNAYPNAGVATDDSSVPDYYDRLRDLTVFERIAMFWSHGVTIGGEGSAERVAAVTATPSFFELLRTPAYRGRVFRAEEGELGSEHEVILSYALWQRLFAGSEAALGRDLRIGGVPYAIVGVMPPDFRFAAADAQLWTPLAFTAEQKADSSRHSNNWTMIGRLKPGATILQVQQQLDALNARNLERFPAMKQVLVDAGFHSVAVPLQDHLVRELRPILYLLWAGVACVLLIGCVNIANLVLVRASGRVKELATRQSLGAGYARIARQLLTETTLLTVAGGVGGVLLGKWAMSLLGLLNLDELPRGHEIHMDAFVVLAGLGLAVALGVLIGGVPLVGLRRLKLNAMLREEGRGGTSGRGARRARRALVTAQVAFAFVLLVGAGLLFESFRAVLAVHPGFNPDGVMTAMISLPGSRYKDAAAVRGFTERLLDASRRVPGARATGLTSTIPFGGNYNGSVLIPEGYNMPKGESLISVDRISVSAGYLEAMQTPLLSGRWFNSGDVAGAARVIVVEERLARKFWPGQDPIGRRLYGPDDPEHLTAGPKTEFLTVVGVVHDVRLTGLVDTEGHFGACYYPFAQSPAWTFAVALRSGGDPKSMVSALRHEVAAIDPELPIFSVKTMDERLRESLVSRRVPMLLALGFGAVALFLSALGIYGVLAYQVAQRRREIGIRMALGGTARSIFRLVLVEGMGMLAVGLGIGLAGALIVGRAMRSLLYGVQPMSPTVLAAVVTILGAAALLAAILPAHRAQRIDPAAALADQ